MIETSKSATAPTGGASTDPQKTGYHHGDLREALLVAAEAELVEKGVEGFSLRGVAKRAGVSHAAPAHHFRDTAALLTALATVAAQRFHRSMTDRQARAEPDAHAQFIASGLGYIEFALANPSLFELMFGSNRPDSTNDAFVTQSSAAFKVLVDGVAALRGRDPLRSDEGKTDIAAAWAMVHGIAHLLKANRMRFLKPGIDDDREAVLTAMIERVAPQS